MSLTTDRIAWRPLAKPLLVIVSGAPASGKTTLARLLADSLPLPLVSKDRLRQVFHDAFGGQTRAESRALVGPTFAVYNDLLTELLRAGVGAVAECNYHRGISEPELGPIAALGTPMIVHCQTDRDLSYRRFRDRHALLLDERRYAFDGETIASLDRGERVDAWERAESVEIGAPILRVDTTDGYAPTLDGILAFIRQHAARPGAAAFNDPPGGCSPPS